MIDGQVGPYRILENLRSGGMGHLVLALDPRLQRKVVLKFLPDALNHDENSRRRFERESNALAALNHPNIVTIHAVEETEGRLYLVMEWIEGSPLSELIPRDGLALDRCLDILLPVTHAVASAHKAGIVHRDLKPANVMVRSDGVVKVVDFGLAKMEQRTLVGPAPRESALTRQGIVVGTIPYMSPEQLEAQTADNRSDIFSLGVMLFEMATGRLPFQGASDASIASAILRDEPPRLASIKADLAPELDTIVQRCLLKNPNMRYPDALAFQEALIDLQSKSRQGLLGSTSGKRARTRIKPAAWGLVAALTLALAATGFLWMRRTPAARRDGAPSLLSVALAAPAAVGATIAVLPMRNLSSDPEQEYFSDGATEAMIADLAKVSALRVTSRNSVMRYKGAAADNLKEIAETLGVVHLVQGSVMRAGDQVAVVVHLVDPATNQELWGETYHGSMSSLMGFEGRVAEAVAGKVLGSLSPEARARLGKHPDVPDDVYEAYLRGRFFQNKRSPDNVLKGLDLFQQALAKAPNFALAWAASAESYAQLGSFGYAVMSPRESLPKAEAAARKAIALEDSLSEAHGALAIALLLDLDWSHSATEFERALSLNPSNAEAWQQYAGYLSSQGRHAEAIQAARRARELDPLSLIINETVAIAYFFSGDMQHATTESNNTLGLEPSFWLAHHLLGEAASYQGKYDDAEHEFQRALELTKRNAFTLSALGRNYVRAGKKEQARAILTEIETRAAKEYISPVQRAKLHFALGDMDEGFRWMNKAIEERDHNLAFLGVDPDFAPLRQDARFKALLQKVALDATPPPATAKPSGPSEPTKTEGTTSKPPTPHQMAAAGGRRAQPLQG
ncbi:MAG: protein kinase [Acidobacteriota bacterium]